MCETKKGRKKELKLRRYGQREVKLRGKREKAGNKRKMEIKSKE